MKSLFEAWAKKLLDKQYAIRDSEIARRDFLRETALAGPDALRGLMEAGLKGSEIDTLLFYCSADDCPAPDARRIAAALLEAYCPEGSAALPHLFHSEASAGRAELLPRILCLMSGAQLRDPQLPDALLKAQLTCAFDLPGPVFNAKHLHKALAEGLAQSAAKLLDSGLAPDPLFGATALFHACLAPGAQTAKLLLDRGIDPCQPNPGPADSPWCKSIVSPRADGSKILTKIRFSSLFDGATPLFSACASNNAAAARLLIKAGADPCAATPKGLTPALIAACCAAPDALAALIAAGAAAPGRSPLLEAACIPFGESCARLLISAGHHPDGLYENGLPLAKALGSPESYPAAAALLAGGADHGLACAEDPEKLAALQQVYELFPEAAGARERKLLHSGLPELEKAERPKRHGL